MKSNICRKEQLHTIMHKIIYQDPCNEHFIRKFKSLDAQNGKKKGNQLSSS